MTCTEKLGKNGRLAIAALLLVAVAAVIVWLLLGSQGDDSETATAHAALQEATIVTPEQLKKAGLVYWAGPMDDTAIELSRPEEDRVFVRYLTEGVEAGDPGTEFITIGTYVMPDAAAMLERQAEREGGETETTPDGKATVYETPEKTNVYFALPDSDVQIEVFSPIPGEARELIQQGKVVPAS